MKKILSLLMAMAMTITVMLVVVLPMKVEAISINPVNVKGSYYTDSPALAEMLDIVFSGDIDIYRASDSTEVSMPIGKNMSKSTEYYPKNYRGYTGYQCYAYANAVYNKLFKEVVGHGTSSPNSKTVISGGSNTASFEMFSNAKVRCGAYIRTTNYANGSYNGNAGHSMIILSYDETYITYVGGNQDANGIVDVRRETWSEFNAAHISGRGRYISHVVQPKDSYYDSLYPSSPKNTLTINYHANGGTIAGPVAIGTNYRVDTTNGDWAYARSGPGTSYSQIDGFAPGSIVAVIETKKMSDYTWGKIKYGKEAWVALGDWMTPVGTAYDHFYYIDPSSSIIANINNNHIITSVLTYGQELKDGLYNNTTLNLYREGYNFLGWSLTADGNGTIIDQDKAIKPEEIVPELVNGSLTVTMYAIWEKAECSHDYQYQSNDNQHWQQCANCGYKTAEVPHDYRPILATSGAHLATEDGHYMGCNICQKATRFEHTYDNSCDAACNVCEYTRVPTHNYEYTASDNKWCWQECTICGDATEKDLHRVEHSIKYDETHHWVVCKDCAYLVDYTPHNFTNDCDTTCNTCEYTRTTEHTYDNGCDNSCNICGAIREVGTHTWKNSYNHNASNHWKECTSCGYKTEEGAHNYTPALSSSGNYLVTKVGHYMTCDICDRSQLQDHIYDNDCDAICNICNFESGTRNPDHSYSNSCDTSCNACGAIREVVTHTFDNSCDTDCNICGETRSTQHVYDDENDTTCNVCGEVRTVETLPTTTPADTEPNTEPSTEPNKEQISDPDTNETTNNNNSSNSDQNDDNDNGIDDTTIIVVAGAVAVSCVSVFGIALVIKKKH